VVALAQTERAEQEILLALLPLKEITAVTEVVLTLPVVAAVLMPLVMLALLSPDLVEMVEQDLFPR
jgi:hypothetical protein